MRLSYTQTNEIDYIPKLFRSRKSLIKMADIINTSSPPTKSPTAPPPPQVCIISKPLSKTRQLVHSYSLSFICCQENREPI